LRKVSQLLLRTAFNLDLFRRRRIFPDEILGFFLVFLFSNSTLFKVCFSDRLQFGYSARRFTTMLEDYRLTLIKTLTVEVLLHLLVLCTEQKKQKQI
jgi:hypothetical protein